MATPNITLYTFATPNGFKISTVLEELGLPYKVRVVDISAEEQKEDWYLKINPNGRLPAITDGSTRIFESGAIMLYLVDKYDTSRKISYAPVDLPGYTEQLGWLFWQIGGIGPMQGQAHHFNILAPVRSDWGIQRYAEETKRLYMVLNTRLEASPYIAGDKFTIADIATVFWVHVAPKFLLWDLGEWPAIKKWYDGILQRQAVQQALKVPEPQMTEQQYAQFFATKRQEMAERSNGDLH